MKEQISNSYMKDQKNLHGKKKLPTVRELLITGVSDNNIGERIHDRLSEIGNVRSIREKDFDLTNEFDVSRVINRNMDCDTLILCHGYTDLDWIEDQRFELMTKMVHTNLISHMNLISLFAHTTMCQEYRKTIVVIGSMAAGAVLNGSAPYCAAKAGLQHFIKCVAWELAPKGFDVYLINPSNVADSPMSDKTISDLSRYRNLSIKEATEYWAANNPRDGFLTKGEIAELTFDLVMGKYPYLSGTPLNLGGGQR